MYVHTVYTTVGFLVSRYGHINHHWRHVGLNISTVTQLNLLTNKQKITANLNSNYRNIIRKLQNVLTIHIPTYQPHEHAQANYDCCQHQQSDPCVNN